MAIITDVNIAFSFGRNQFDNRPKLQNECTWDQLFEVLDQVRAPRKGELWISSDFGGDGRRCLANAMPRNWLPFDFDGNCTDTQISELLAWFRAFRAYAYETFSSSCNARRMRFIVLLDRPISDKEARHLGPIITRAAPLKEGWDASVYQASQPLFLAPENKKIWVLEGDAIPVDRLLNAYPIPVPRRYVTRQAVRGGDDPYQYFVQNDWILKEGAHGIDVICPWANAHTGGDTSGTVLFRPSIENDYAGGFRCQHHSCEGKRINHIYRLICGKESI